MEEAAKYYANILWPLSNLILKKIEELEKTFPSIKMIAPSHGIIWRKQLNKILESYLGWAKNETKKKAVIVYETMWTATQKMAKIICEGLIDSGIEVKVFDVNQSNYTEIIKEMLDAKCYIIGSSTHNNNLLPNIAGFLEFLKGLHPKNRVGCVFGSYGWSGAAIATLQELLKQIGIRLIKEPISVKYFPSEDDLLNCYKYGRELAELIF
jgi:flavorubredoxin